MNSAFAAILLLAGQAAAGPAEPAPGHEAQAEKRMITPPRFVHGDRAPYPEEAKALGHHGATRVSISIDDAGKVTGAEIARSSHSEILDASALATAQTAQFTPALDAQGNPMAFTFEVPYEFYKSKSAEPGGGLVRYGCADFTLDTDWFDSLGLVDKRGKPQSSQLETMLLGLRTISAGGASIFPTDPKVFLKMMDDHKKNWAKAREKCRANPDKLLIDYLDNRKLIERLSEVAMQERS